MIDDLKNIEAESLECIKIKAAIYNVMIELQNIEGQKDRAKDRIKILSVDLEKRIDYEREQGRLKLISDSSRMKITPKELKDEMTPPTPIKPKKRTD